MKKGETQHQGNEEKSHFAPLFSFQTSIIDYLRQGFNEGVVCEQIFSRGERPLKTNFKFIGICHNPAVRLLGNNKMFCFRMRYLRILPLSLQGQLKLFLNRERRRREEEGGVHSRLLDCVL